MEIFMFFCLSTWLIFHIDIWVSQAESLTNSALSCLVDSKSNSQCAASGPKFSQVLPSPLCTHLSFYLCMLIYLSSYLYKWDFVVWRYFYIYNLCLRNREGWKISEFKFIIGPTQHFCSHLSVYKVATHWELIMASSWSFSCQLSVLGFVKNKSTISLKIELVPPYTFFNVLLLPLRWTVPVTQRKLLSPNRRCSPRKEFGTPLFSLFPWFIVNFQPHTLSQYSFLFRLLWSTILLDGNVLTLSGFLWVLILLFLLALVIQNIADYLKNLSSICIFLTSYGYLFV